MREFLAVAYLFFPLLIGLTTHGLCIKFNGLAFLCHPLDGGRKIRGARIFGDNKTYRGVAAVSLGTAVGFALQALVFHRFAWFRSLELFDYSFFKSVAVGLAVGVAAMLSELPNSFIKRRFEIAPGSAASGLKGLVFYVYDQIDFLVGAWLVLAFVVPVTAARILLSVGFIFVMHQLLTTIGYVLGMRKTAR
jgi:hypothetical protein